jgi:hypothetical protein
MPLGSGCWGIEGEVIVVLHCLLHSELVVIGARRPMRQQPHPLPAPA